MLQTAQSRIDVESCQVSKQVTMNNEANANKALMKNRVLINNKVISIGENAPHAINFISNSREFDLTVSHHSTMRLQSLISMTRSRFDKWPILLTLFTAMTMVGTVGLNSAQAASLGDLFNSMTGKSAQPEFLSVDKAFTVVPLQQKNTLQVSFEITPGHYVYKDKLKLKLPSGVRASSFTFSQPSHTINDPNFGKVAIFDQPQVTATATLINNTSQTIASQATVTWQGCAKAGLCYPPQKEQVTLKVAPNSIKKKIMLTH